MKFVFLAIVLTLTTMVMGLPTQEAATTAGSYNDVSSAIRDVMKQLQEMGIGSAETSNTLVNRQYDSNDYKLDCQNWIKSYDCWRYNHTRCIDDGMLESTDGWCLRNCHCNPGDNKIDLMNLDPANETETTETAPEVAKHQDNGIITPYTGKTNDNGWEVVCDPTTKATCAKSGIDCTNNGTLINPTHDEVCDKGCFCFEPAKPISLNYMIDCGNEQLNKFCKHGGAHCSDGGDVEGAGSNTICAVLCTCVSQQSA